MPTRLFQAFQSVLNMWTFRNVWELELRNNSGS